MELKSGIVHFDPADPTQYHEVRMGKYIKRLIPDRVKQEREIMSNHNARVFSPFNENYFNYYDIPPAQELFRFKINNKTQRIIASDSPLTRSPHTLLVPVDKRPQFILEKDIIKKRTGKSVEEYLLYLVDYIPANIDKRGILNGLGELVDEDTKKWTKSDLLKELDFYLKAYKTD